MAVIKYKNPKYTEGGSEPKYIVIPTLTMENDEVYVGTTEPTEGEKIWVNPSNGLTKYKNGESWEDLVPEVDLSNYLAKDNSTEYIPSGEYNPSTKGYVDQKWFNINPLIMELRKYNAPTDITVFISNNYTSWDNFLQICRNKYLYRFSHVPVSVSFDSVDNGIHLVIMQQNGSVHDVNKSYIYIQHFDVYKDDDGTIKGYLSQQINFGKGNGTKALMDDGKYHKVWTPDNDGAGSSLDADLLDGYHAVGNALSTINRYTKVGSDSSLTSYWCKVADITLPSGAIDRNVTFYVEDLYAQSANKYPGAGILRIRLRVHTDEGDTFDRYTGNKLEWLLNNRFDNSRCRLYYDNSTNKAELWCNTLGIYNFVKFTVISESDRNTLTPDKGFYNLYNSNITAVQTPTLTKYVESVNATVANSVDENSLAYWYENNENTSSTTCATGGNRNVIESLKSKFKRCTATPYGDDSALICYYSEETSGKWPDGTTTSITNNSQNRMVHFPKYYHKTIERSPGIWRTYISEQQIDNDYIEEPEALLAMFEGAFGSNGRLISGASQTSASSKTLAEFVAGAKVHGPLWGIGNYRTHATIARMFCAYYGNTNISTSNSNIPCSGGTKRYNYGKTGGTFDLGNRDGRAAVSGDAGYYSTNFLGLEDCYYSKWEFVQGINILKGKYVVYDGGSFPDKDVEELEAAGATNIRVVGYEPNPDATAGYSGWTKAIVQGKYGDVLPTAHGGSETTYYSDGSYFNPTGNRIFFRSGGSGDGSRCGVFVAGANVASSTSWTYLGARLAFYGKIVVVDSDTFKKMQV